MSLINSLKQLRPLSYCLALLSIVQLSTRIPVTYWSLAYKLLDKEKILYEIWKIYWRYLLVCNLKFSSEAKAILAFFGNKLWIKQLFIIVEKGLSYYIRQNFYKSFWHQYHLGLVLFRDVGSLKLTFSGMTQRGCF